MGLSRWDKIQGRRNMPHARRAEGDERFEFNVGGGSLKVKRKSR